MDSGESESQRSMMAAAAGVRPPGLGLLRVGERHHPQGQDLVDLECVVEIARTLVRHFGVVVEDDRRGEHDVVAADEDRIGAVAPAGPGRLGGIVGRFEERDECRAVDGQHRVHGHQTLRHDIRSQRSVLTPCGGVLDRCAHLDVGRADRFGSRDDSDCAVDGDALTNEATDQGAVGTVDKLGVGSALEVERHHGGGGATPGDDERRQVHNVIDGLVPFDMGRPVHLERVDRSESGPRGCAPLPAQPGFNPATLGLQASDAHLEDRGLASSAEVDEALGAGRPALGPARLAVGPGSQHTPLETHLVLAGGRPVRVEDVPLVEHGVGHGSRRLETILPDLDGRFGGSRAGRAHGPPSWASLSSWAKAWSHVGSPRVARKR